MAISLIPHTRCCLYELVHSICKQSVLYVQSDHLGQVANVWHNLLFVLSLDNAPRYGERLSDKRDKKRLGLERVFGEVLVSLGVVR